MLEINMDALTLPDVTGTIQTVVHEVGYQSWTKDNLWVLSEHENIEYFTTRWDALCPYIEVTNEMLKMAPKLYKGGKFSKGLEAANEEKRRTKSNGSSRGETNKEGEKGTVN
jgi:hypothetical protein